MTAHDILNNPFLNKELPLLRGAKGTRPYWFTFTLCSNDWGTSSTNLCTNANKDQWPGKRLFLMEIFNTNRTLFYYLCSTFGKFNPIVYDPTIADTIEGYSDLFVDPQYAGYTWY